MREVDEALARAYAQREQSDPPRGAAGPPLAGARTPKPSIGSVVSAAPAIHRSNCSGPLNRAHPRARVGRTV